MHWNRLTDETEARSSLNVNIYVGEMHTFVHTHGIYLKHFSLPVYSRGMLRMLIERPNLKDQHE